MRRRLSGRVTVGGAGGEWKGERGYPVRLYVPRKLGLGAGMIARSLGETYDVPTEVVNDRVARNQTPLLGPDAVDLAYELSELPIRRDDLGRVWRPSNYARPY